MERMSKTAKVLDTICKILFWLNIVAVAVLVVGLLWVFVCYVFENGSTIEVADEAFIMSVQLDQAVFEIADSVWPVDAGNTSVLRICTMLLEVISAGASCYGFAIARRILAPMKEQRPFAETAARDLKRLGWFTIVVGAAHSIMEVVMDTVVFRLYDFSQLFLSDKITSIRLETSMDFTFLIVAAVIFLLSYIFRYGAALQQQADETL